MSEKIHLPCPDLGCGSSDAYCWNEAKGVGHCKSCDLGTWVYDNELWARHGKQGKGFKLGISYPSPLYQIGRAHV